MSESAVTGTPSVRSLERCVAEIAGSFTASMGSQEEQIVPYSVLTELMRASGGGMARIGISRDARSWQLSSRSAHHMHAAISRLSWSSI